MPRRHGRIEPAFPRLRTRLDLFAYLMAFAVITHHHPGSSTSDWDTPFVPVSLALAVALLVRPGSPALLLCLFAATVLDAVVEAPFFPNHYILLAVAFAAALPLALGPMRRRDHGLLERRIFGLSTASLLAMYPLAAFGKLNDGFIDPLLGCAASQYNLFAETVNVLPVVQGGWPGRALAFGTLAVELGIPVLLLVRRTRWVGLAVGTAFHYAMAANGHAAFSAIALALYVPFLPHDFLPALASEVRRYPAARFVLPSFAVVGAAIVALGTVLALLDLDVGSSLSARVPYLVLAPGLVVLAALALRHTRQPATPLRAGTPAAVAAALVVVFLVATAALPYLGVRTQGTLTMFANLRTEASAGYWNHWLVPSSVQVVDRNDEWVELVSSQPEVRFRTLEPEIEAVAVNLFEVRRVVADLCRSGPVALTYREIGSGRTVALDDACATELGRQAGVLERKVVWFRPVIDPNECQH